MTVPFPPAKSVPVSVLVPVLNEEANIPACLATIQWAKEIVVIDSNSRDRTVALSEEHGARVVQFKWDGKFPKKKNWALANVDWQNEWVLILDADEHILPELAQEIAEVVKQNSLDGYYINRRFMFMGGWLRFCGYYPSWNLRLFRHELGRYERLDVSGDTNSGDNEVHEHVLISTGESRVGWLKHDMLHYAYPNIHVWIEKHNRYSNWEAKVRTELHDEESGEKLKASLFGNPLERKRALKRLGQSIPLLSPTLRFVYHYIIKQGFRDGYRGFVFCRLLAFYEFLSVIKAAEMRIQEKQKKGGH
ncbi:MAG: glycosyltransferase family 2 protein [Candidatus Sumerlaeia bacterium]|nr:glycosyltransferase family 2 protein [Candidatus Sumerlaeia bacterium]